MNQLSRQWQIVRLLAGTGWSIRELAGRFNVTGRTIRRDLNALQAAGIELRAKSERHDRKRYRLKRRTIPPME